MRDFGKLFSGFWTSSDVQGMTDDAKLLAAFLLTSHHSNIIGCFRLPDGYISDDLGWDSERVTKGFRELFEKGFATRNEQSKWVVIHKYMKWNPPENPNQLKAVTKAFNNTPSDSGVKQELARSLAEFCQGFPEDVLKPFLNPFETVSKPVVVTVTETVIAAPPKPLRFDPMGRLEELGVPSAIANDFLALRTKKKAPLTKTALDVILRESQKAEIPLTQALETCCQRGWQGFEAEWLKKSKPASDDPYGIKGAI